VSNFIDVTDQFASISNMIWYKSSVFIFFGLKNKLPTGIIVEPFLIYSVPLLRSSVRCCPILKLTSSINFFELD
ncbi:MAG: hypothetical protein WAQ28_04160, partial [Bacteroidia bacterium]